MDLIFSETSDRIIFDTGFSGFAVVGDRTLTQLRTDYNFKISEFSEHSDSKSFRFGDGKMQTSSRQQNVEFLANGRRICFSVYVLPDSDVPMLLGERFLKETNSHFQYGEKPYVYSDVFGKFYIGQNSNRIHTLTEQDKKTLTEKYPTHKRLWNLTYNSLQKLHGQRHVGITQTLHQLKATVPDEVLNDIHVKQFFRELEQVLTDIRKNCDVCARKAKQKSFPQLLSETAVLNFNDKVSCDIIISRNNPQNPYSYLMLVDHATSFVRIIPAPGRITHDVATAMILQHWVSIFGHIKTFIADQDGPLLKSSQYLEGLGTNIQTRPSGSHQAAGKVERQIYTFRECCETDASYLETCDIIQVRAYTALIENSINNVQTNRSSPALRVLGYSTSVEFNALNDTQNTMFFRWEVRDRALKSFREAITRDSLRRTLAETSGGHEHLFEAGDLVWVFHRTTAEKSMLRQSGVVLYFDPATTQYAVRTSAGGVILVSRRDVSRRIADDPGHTEIAKTVKNVIPFADAPPVQDNANCPRCKNRRSKKPHTCEKGRAHVHFSSVSNTEAPADVLVSVENKTSTEAAKQPTVQSELVHSEFVNYDEVMFKKDYESIFSLEAVNQYDIGWDDLSPESKQIAYDEASDVYYRNGVWKKDKTSELNEEQFQKYCKTKKVVKLDAALVEKAKIDPKRPDKLKGKVRIAVRGFKDKINDNTSNDAPTVNSTTVNVAEFNGLRNKSLIPAVIDFENAFFKIDEETQVHHLQTETWMKIPKQLVGGRVVYRRLWKEAQGMRGAARSWFETLRAVLLEFGFTQSRTDPCLFFFWENKDGNDVLSGQIVIHVDDGRIWATKNIHLKFQEFLKKKDLFSDYNFGFKDDSGVFIPECRNPDFADVSVCNFLGTKMTTDLRARTTDISQNEYISAKLKYLELSKDEKIEGTDLNHRLTDFLKGMGGLLWCVTKTQKCYSFEASYLASKRNVLTTEVFQEYNNTIACIKKNPETIRITGITDKVKMILVMDGSETSKKTDRGYTGRIVGLMAISPPGTAGTFSPLSIRAGKSPRATHSSYDIESVSSIQCLDEGLALGVQLQEFLKPPKQFKKRAERFSFAAEGTSKIDFYTELHSDAELLCNGVNLSKRIDPTMGARRREDLDDLKECIRTRDLAMVGHIAGKKNPTDRLTKPLARCADTHILLKTLLQKNWYSPPLTRGA